MIPGVAWVGFLGLSLLSGAVMGAALGLTGFMILHFSGEGAMQRGMEAVWNTLNGFTLTAIPMFILLGEVLVHSGLSNRVFRSITPLFSCVKGGLLHANIVVCTVFGAVSGSSMSVAAAVGSVSYPELRDRGYHRPLIVATLAAGGTLGLLIPPSLSLLIYGAITGTSIGKLFVGGILPGLLLAGFFMLTVAWLVRRSPHWAPAPAERMDWGFALRSLLDIWPLLLLVFGVLGSLFAGLATPTEAASVGVVMAIVLGFFWGHLTVAGLLQSVRATVKVFSVIGMVFMGAVILAQSIALLGLPQQLLGGLTDLGISKYWVLLILTLFYILLGCFFDGLSMMIMTLPVAFPLMQGLGFDPIWFGIYVTIMIEIGMLTPPVGMNLFVLVGVTQSEVGLAEAARAAVPFWLSMLGGLFLLVVFPAIVTWLPSYVR